MKKQTKADKAFIKKLKTITVGMGVKPGKVLTGPKLQQWAKENKVPTEVKFKCGHGMNLVAASEVAFKCRPKHDDSGEVEVCE